MTSRVAAGSAGIPLWNPFVASGQPFAANPQYELFHPLTWLLFVLPFELAFRLQTLLPPLVAVVAMRFLLRTLGTGRAAALFGALSFGFGGLLLSSANLLPILFAAAPLPATLAFVVRFARRGRGGDAAGAALSLGAQVLAGEPSTVMLTMALLPATIAEVGRGGRDLSGEAAPPGLRRRLLLLPAVLLLGIAVSGAMLVPGTRLAAKTVRAAGIAEGTSTVWSMPAIRLADLVNPATSVRLAMADSATPGTGAYGSVGRPFYISLYPGLLATLLALLAVVLRPGRFAAWWGTAVVGFLFALGGTLPFWGLARRFVPLFAGLRYPEKFALLVVFPVAVLAAFGLDAFLAATRDGRRAALRIAGGAGILGLLGLAAVGVALASGRAAAAHPLGGEIAVGLLGDCARVVLLAGAFLGCSLVASRWGRAAGAAALVAVAAVDLSLAGRPVVPTMPPERLTTPPEAIRPLLAAPLPGRLFHAGEWSSNRPADPAFASPPIPTQWGFRLAFEQDFDLTHLVRTRRATELFWSAVKSDPALAEPLLARAGVAAVLSLRPGADSSPRLVASRIAAPRPLAACVERVERIATDAQWVPTVMRLGGAVTHAALVEARHAEGLPDRPAPCRATIVASSPNDLLVDVVAVGPGDSFLAVGQTFDDGWRATIDEAPARLVPTDLALSGLVVPPGRHRVALAYRDRSVTAGIAVSLAALAVCGVLLGVSRFRRG